MVMSDQKKWSDPDFLALERISVLVQDGCNWSPQYAWGLGAAARRHADLCTAGTRAGIELILATHTDPHAIAGWRGDAEPPYIPFDFEPEFQEEEPHVTVGNETQTTAREPSHSAQLSSTRTMPDTSDHPDSHELRDWPNYGPKDGRIADKVIELAYKHGMRVVDIEALLLRALENALSS